MTTEQWMVLSLMVLPTVVMYLSLYIHQLRRTRRRITDELQRTRDELSSITRAHIAQLDHLTEQSGAALARVEAFYASKLAESVERLLDIKAPHVVVTYRDDCDLWQYRVSPSTMMPTPTVTFNRQQDTIAIDVNPYRVDVHKVAAILTDEIAARLAWRMANTIHNITYGNTPWTKT